MTWYGKHPSLKRDSEPIDVDVWHWFVCNGPHGERFCWHESDLEFLRKFINEKAEADPKFIENAIYIAIESLGNSDPVLVGTGIQVLCAIGNDSELEMIKDLLNHPDASISLNARCCLFERGIKVNRKET